MSSNLGIKGIFLVLFLCFYSFYSCGQSFNTISKRIERLSNHNKKKHSRITFHFVRKLVDKSGNLDFINFQSDTLYLLETNDVTTGTIYGEIWNQRGKVNYSYYRGDLSLNQNNLFTSETEHLLENWNTVKIRQLEKEYNILATSNTGIYGTRVVIHKKNIEILSIVFRLPR